jgi:ArsR family transcriptional regulator
MNYSSPQPECDPAEHSRRLEGVDPQALERAARLFRAIGEPARLRLLALLAQGESCVTELADAEGEQISTISQRLRVLRAEDLVKRHRRGKHIHYSLADGHVLELVRNALAHSSETKTGS